MRRFSIPFVVLCLISISTVSSRAQREIGAKSVVLDDGSGNTLTLRYLNLPPIAGNSFYTFLPGGGSPTPAGTTNNSMLRWDAGTTSWLEDVNVLATTAGDMTANSLLVTSGAINGPSSGVGLAPDLILKAGSSVAGFTGSKAILQGGTNSIGSGGDAVVIAGNGVWGGWAFITGGDAQSVDMPGGNAILTGGRGNGTQPGGPVEIEGGYGGGSAGNGGSVQIYGGTAGSPGGSGGSISCWTTPNAGLYQERVTITPAGLVGIGPGSGPTWPFEVNQSGNATTATTTATTALGNGTAANGTLYADNGILAFGYVQYTGFFSNAVGGVTVHRISTGYYELDFPFNEPTLTTAVLMVTTDQFLSGQNNVGTTEYVSLTPLKIRVKISNANTNTMQDSDFGFLLVGPHS